ncbi:MAG: hypothetical protein JXR94_17615 [Candidatus Hydrogenedentes bacterium]|nr:hypothetical protein [Candidatus Hydrogenedentota bacterium]
MKRFTIWIALTMLVVAPAAFAQDAAKLKNPEIIGHYFTTGIRGPLRQLGVKDPDVGRWVVLLVRASADDELTLFSHDFILRYFLDSGAEERSTCDGIAEVDPETKLVEGLFDTKTEPRLTAGPGTVVFALANYIEAEVEDINLCRVGTGGSLPYKVGSQRPTSVFVTTNDKDTKRLDALKAALEKGGYYVATSSSLTDSATDIKVTYQANAEAAAREISQRIMTELSVSPTVEEMEGISTSYDVLVWVGK